MPVPEVRAPVAEVVTLIVYVAGVPGVAGVIEETVTDREVAPEAGKNGIRNKIPSSIATNTAPHRRKISINLEWFPKCISPTQFFL